MIHWQLVLLAFVAAAGVVALVAYLLPNSSRRIGRRLQSLGQDPAATASNRNHDRFPAVTRLLERRGGQSAVQDALDRAGVVWRPSEFVAAVGALLVVLTAGGWFLFRHLGSAGQFGAAAGIALATLIPYATLKVLEKRRLRQFERQLPDALILIASSLHSGYGILRAIQAVRDEMKPPISVEFGKTLDETNVGASTAEALLHLARRVPLPDLDIAVTAILIQLETGGNLAEIMEIVAATVRERQRIRAEVDTLTAEGRMSGIILCALPIVMAAILTAVNPGYMSALWHTGLGHLLVLVAAGLMCMGGVVINRMLQIDF